MNVIDGVWGHACMAIHMHAYMHMAIDLAAASYTTWHKGAHIIAPQVLRKPDTCMHGGDSPFRPDFFRVLFISTNNVWYGSEELYIFLCLAFVVHCCPYPVSPLYSCWLLLLLFNCIYHSLILDQGRTSTVLYHSWVHHQVTNSTFKVLTHTHTLSSCKPAKYLPNIIDNLIT